MSDYPNYNVQYWNEIYSKIKKGKKSSLPDRSLDKGCEGLTQPPPPAEHMSWSTYRTMQQPLQQEAAVVESVKKQKEKKNLSKKKTLKKKDSVLKKKKTIHL